MIKVSLSSADSGQDALLAIHNKYAWELREVRLSKMKMEGLNTYAIRKGRSPVHPEVDFLPLREKRAALLKARHEELEPEPKRTIFRGELI